MGPDKQFGSLWMRDFTNTRLEAGSLSQTRTTAIVLGKDINGLNVIKRRW